MSRLCGSVPWPHSEPTGALAQNERLHRALAALSAWTDGKRPDPTGPHHVPWKLQGQAWSAADEALTRVIHRHVASLSRLVPPGPLHPLDAIALERPIAGDHGLRDQVAAWMDARLDHYHSQPAALEIAPRGWADDERTRAARIRGRLRQEERLRMTIYGAALDVIMTECERRAAAPQGDRWGEYAERCEAACRHPLAEWVYVDEEIRAIADATPERGWLRMRFLEVPPDIQAEIEARLAEVESGLRALEEEA